MIRAGRDGHIMRVATSECDRRLLRKLERGTARMTDMHNGLRALMKRLSAIYSPE